MRWFAAARRRAPAALALAALTATALGCGPTGATAAAQGTGGCPGQDVPPPPPAVEELAAPATTPLAVPSEPVGGPLLGGCDDVPAAGAPAPPQVGALSWVLADLDTRAVLAARAPHARHRPASTLKVLTALVVLDRLDPDTVVEGTEEDLRIDGSKAGIGPGGRYTVRQLLAGLLLGSGNDTANALARPLGGPAATTAAMTATAHGLGALDTRPATPSGLDGPGMACSAYDLALLFRMALRDPLFAQTIATRSVPFPGYGARPGFVLSNNSDRLLVDYPGALGAKSGFTDAARHTLVGAAERGGRRLVVALARGEQTPVPMWKQAAALLDWGFALPLGTASVGVLVDSAPAESVEPNEQTGPTTTTPSPRPGVDRWAAAAAIGGVLAITGIAVVGLAARRRSRR